MFGFISRDSKIVNSINEYDASYVLKLIKKYKKQLFRTITNGDKDYIFSNIIIEIVNDIEENSDVKLDELIKIYINKIKNNDLKIKGLKIYNDKDLLKHIIKQWEVKSERKSDYCEIFNMLLDGDIQEAGNEPCYSMIVVNGDRIDIKQFTNDFALYYQNEDDSYSSDFKHVDHIEIKKNTNGQITGADICFSDNFSVMVWAQTVIDSENIEKLQLLAQIHGVVKESKEEFKTVS